MASDPRERQKLAQVALMVEPQRIPAHSKKAHSFWRRPYHYTTATRTELFLGCTVIEDSYFEGPSRGISRLDEPVSAQWHATGGIRASEVSMGVGFNVTHKTSQCLTAIRLLCLQDML